MHTKTHMWGRRCERGVRVLRACAHGASICVAVRRDPEWLVGGCLCFGTLQTWTKGGGIRRKEVEKREPRRAAFRRWTPMLQSRAWRLSRGLLAEVALATLS